jgi:hypothetical protein
LVLDGILAEVKTTLDFVGRLIISIGHFRISAIAHIAPGLNRVKTEHFNKHFAGFPACAMEFENFQFSIGKHFNLLLCL